MPYRPPVKPQAVAEEVVFPAGPYQLQGELAYPPDGPVLGTVVVAGPHPLLGGDLQNNVVQGLGDGLADRGLATLRFNYRGVGRSEGPRLDVARHVAQFWQTSHVAGELDFWQDVQGAVDYVRPVAGPGLPLVLVGYSFGCALLPSVRVIGGPAAVVLIAPTVTRHDYDAYRSVRCPLLVIASQDDFATDADQLRRWFDRLPAPRRLIQERFDNHFFRGHEDWLATTVFDFLESQRR